MPDGTSIAKPSLIKDLGSGARRILVVENSAGVRECLSQILAEAGFEIVLATDAGEAIECLKRDAPSVVITDLDLVWGSGMAITSFVKWLTTDRTHIPVILLSARLDAGLARRAMDEGAFACFPKPFDPQELIRVIRRATERVLRSDDRGAPGLY